MRKLLIPVLLVALTGCITVHHTKTGSIDQFPAPVTMVSDVAPAPDADPNASKSYTYYYSASQLKALANVDTGVYGKTFAPRTVTIKKKKLAYTECTLSSAKGPVGKFRDYKKVGTVTGQPCKAF